MTASRWSAPSCRRQSIAAIRSNARLIETLMDSLKPDAVVTDSTYFALPRPARQVPFLAVNNADVVHTLHRRYADRPKSIRLQFHAVEELDFLHHRLVPDVSLSPRLDTSAETPAAPAIVSARSCGRPAARRCAAPEAHPHHAVRLALRLVGEPEARARELQRRHRRRRSTRRPRARAMPLPGRVLNTPELAAEADMLVVNGGFSAVSEAFVMRKPLIVIPVPNHAEQWVNARTVCELGVGMMAHDQDLDDALTQGLARIESFRRLCAAAERARRRGTGGRRILEAVAA